MKILSVNNAYLPNQGGFSYRSVKLYENYSKLGHNVYIISPTKVKDNLFDEQYYRKKGISIYRSYNKISTLSKILKLNKENDFDAIITHNFFWWLAISVFYPRRNLINEVHSIKLYHNKVLRLVQEKILKYWLSKKTSLCFVLSNEAKKILIKKYDFCEEKIIFSPNGYEKKVNHIKKENKNFFIIGYAGTLYEWQGVMNIINNAEKLLDIDESIRIHIIGGGPLLRKIGRIIDNIQQSKKILLTGFVGHKEYHRKISNFDIFLIPRPNNILTNTAIPLKIFDAIENRIPIVMSDAKGLTEILDNESAVIYNSMKQEQLIFSCQYLFKNKDLGVKLAQRATSKLEQWPTFENIAKLQIFHINSL